MQEDKIDSVLILLREILAELRVRRQEPIKKRRSYHKQTTLDGIDPKLVARVDAVIERTGFARYDQ